MKGPAHDAGPFMLITVIKNRLKPGAFKKAVDHLYLIIKHYGKKRQKARS
ncbi:hypothetical protein GCM10023188_05840 [Pontibacter saemangeumensis]|uniref:Uncharacterized protein n=1 Tax=Pontibacter saemangeumensis TaxID=1084525 RepID=A0ABP8LAA8_9BACT